MANTIPRNRSEQRISREEMRDATSRFFSKEGPLFRFACARRDILELVDSAFDENEALYGLLNVYSPFNGEWELLVHAVDRPREYELAPSVLPAYIAKMAACLGGLTHQSKRPNASIKETRVQGIARSVDELADWTDKNQSTLGEHAEAWNESMEICKNALSELTEYAEKVKVFTRQCAEDALEAKMRALSAIAASGRRPKSEDGAVTKLLKAQVELVQAIPHRFTEERGALRNAGTMLRKNAYVRHHRDPFDRRMAHIVAAEAGLTKFLGCDELVKYLKDGDARKALAYYKASLKDVREFIGSAKQYLEQYAPETLAEIDRPRAWVR